MLENSKPRSSALDSGWILAPICAALAILPRLFIITRVAGHDVAPWAIKAGVEWVRTGTWRPSRSPGAPVYEFTIGVLVNALGDSATPTFVYTNILSVACVALSLFLLYWIYREGL